jgi:hypothetical protein
MKLGAGPYWILSGVKAFSGGIIQAASTVTGSKTRNSSDLISLLNLEIAAGRFGSLPTGIPGRNAERCL